jgi:hypothetical protein
VNNTASHHKNAHMPLSARIWPMSGRSTPLTTDRSPPTRRSRTHGSPRAPSEPNAWIRRRLRKPRDPPSHQCEPDGKNCLQDQHQSGRDEPGVGHSELPHACRDADSPNAGPEYSASHSET